MNTTNETEDKDFILLKPRWLKDLGKNEHWLESAIIEDPSILGLGDLSAYESQRLQPSGGKLDLLLGNEAERYEVELQLGITDETHIIRTIEYWDVERRRYPNYEHTAVLVAEEVSGRFFNVIYLLGYNIPIIAIKATAHQVNDTIGLSFTKVLDTRGLIATSDENQITSPVDREYWLQKFSLELLELAENAIRKITNGVPNHQRYYIGSIVDERRNARLKVANWDKGNKNKVELWFHMREIPEVTEKIEDMEIYSRYVHGDRRYGFVIENEEQLGQNLPILRKMFKLAMGEDDGIWPDETDTEQTQENEADSE